MDEYGPSTYGDSIADAYDGWRTLPADTDEAVELLASLAGPGPVLELGIGTGRIAIPLAARGLDVRGVDASEAMVAKLRDKPGGESIAVAMGDFADVPVEGTFSLVFVVFNTFFAILSGQDQARCFENVARHLTDEGVFVMQAFVPDTARFDRGQHVGAEQVGVDEVVLEASIHDAQNQRVDSMHIAILGDGIRLYPVRIRYAWPVELDLMAQAAGLRLRERWGGWRSEPFTAESKQHVSAYARAS